MTDTTTTATTEGAVHGKPLTFAEAVESLLTLDVVGDRAVMARPDGESISGWIMHLIREAWPTLSGEQRDLANIADAIYHGSKAAHIADLLDLRSGPRRAVLDILWRTL